MKHSCPTRRSSDLVARLRQENPLGMSVQLRLVSTLALVAAAAAPPAASARDRAGDGLLFRVSGDKTLIADEARGAAIPNFESAMSIVPDGAIGSAIRWSDGGYVAWQAPGNMYAQRGTLSFFWRSHTPAGEIGRAHV